MDIDVPAVGVKPEVEAVVHEGREPQKWKAGTRRLGVARIDGDPLRHIQQERLPIRRGLPCSWNVRVEPNGCLVSVYATLMDLEVPQAREQGNVQPRPLTEMAMLDGEVEVGARVQ
jgi:hypothetical protein